MTRRNVTEDPVVEIAIFVRRKKTMKRNCDNCIFATRSGGCVAWECEPIPIREAEKAWKYAEEMRKAFEQLGKSVRRLSERVQKEKNAPTPLTIEERTAKSLAELEEAIKNAPTAEPGRVAHWEYLGHRPGIMKHPMSVDYRCTNCGFESYWTTPAVCPNCHAKMERSENDAD